MVCKKAPVTVSMKFETFDPYDAVPRVLDFARKTSLEFMGIVSTAGVSSAHSIEVSFAMGKPGEMELLRQRSALIHTIKNVR